ncbi:hypothetical protein GBAR_LOCUS8553 [Geodia barretti]|uniref:Uncharacterized protein n=1 Tax=Geodia barretti TaxID=519541 RepID=A0AA35WGI4_GEOBA|nr:hypothetical protein GBAR_LOCUS8553 [Geodia barretti]
MYTQPTLPSCLFLGLHTRHRVGVALFGQAHTIASDLRVAGSRYALGPYTPVDPSFVSFSLSLPLSFLAGDTDIRRHSPIPRKCAISLHHSILINFYHSLRLKRAISGNYILCLYCKFSFLSQFSCQLRVH